MSRLSIDLSTISARANAGLASLTPTHIRSCRNLLRDEGRAATTVNQTIAKIISAASAKATTLGYMPLNPCKAVEPLKETKAEAGTFTADQVRALVNAAPTPEWCGFIIAAYFTGQRLRDLADLKWGQIDLAEAAHPAYAGQNRCIRSDSDPSRLFGVPAGVAEGDRP